MCSPKCQLQKQLERSIKRIGKRHIKVISYPSGGFCVESSIGRVLEPFLNRFSSALHEQKSKYKRQVHFFIPYIQQIHRTSIISYKMPLFLTGTHFQTKKNIYITKSPASYRYTFSNKKKVIKCLPCFLQVFSKRLPCYLYSINSYYGESERVFV